MFCRVAAFLPPYRYHNQNQNRVAVAVAAVIKQARLSHRPPEQLLQEHGRREQDGVQLPRAVQAQRNFSRRVRSQVRGLLVRVRLVPVHTGRS
jgi:endonuclease/exonuclease/phosphatase (EEP) superfamily protein YafD